MSDMKSGSFLLHETIDQIITKRNSYPRMILPLAWPVLHCDHYFVVDASEGLDLLSRFVVESLVRFGKRNTHELSSFLGLSEPRLEALLRNLLRKGAVEISSDGTWNVNHIELQVNEEGFTGGTVIQPHGFWISGFDGELLPISSQDQTPHDLRRIDSTSSSWRVIHKNLELKNLPWLRENRENLGTSALKSLLDLEDQNTKAQYGIPTGSIRIDENSPPKLKEILWWLCTLIVDADGLVEIISTGYSDPIKLFSFKPNSKNPCRLPLIHKGDEKRISLTSEPKGMPNPPKDWGPAFQILVDGEKQIYQISNCSQELLAPHNFLNALSALPQSLQFSLAKGYYHNSFSGRIWRLEPADKHCAQVLVMARGIFALRHLAKREESPAIPPEVWWKNLMGSFMNEEWQAQMKKPLPFEVLRSASLASNDSRLIELLDSWDSTCLG